MAPPITRAFQRPFDFDLMHGVTHQPLRAGDDKRGFTVVELVVVLLILGILAAVLAPTLFNLVQSAEDNSVKATLRTVRNAIDNYAINHNGAMPGADGTQATFYADLRAYLRSTDFPTCPVGAKNNLVRTETGGMPLIGDASPIQGWAFDNVSGQFICNSNATSFDRVTLYQSF